MKSQGETVLGIDLLRGVAAGMVLVAHYPSFQGLSSAFWNSFHYGVDIFFVISGFLFGKILSTGVVDLKRFVTRRFMRIYPLYFVSLLLYWLLKGDSQYLLSHLFMLQTLVSPSISAYYNPAYWSLPTELMFYMVLPVIGLFAGRPYLLLHLTYPRKTRP